jgi:hypothetical protein
MSPDTKRFLLIYNDPAQPPQISLHDIAASASPGWSRTASTRIILRAVSRRTYFQVQHPPGRGQHAAPLPAPQAAGFEAASAILGGGRLRRADRADGAAPLGRAARQ